jgi:hypothetical protein
MDINRNNMINEDKISMISEILDMVNIGVVRSGVNNRSQTSITLENAGTSAFRFLSAYPEYKNTMNHVLSICNKYQTTALLSVYLEGLLNDELRNFVN